MNQLIRDLALQSDFGFIVTDRVGSYRGGLEQDDQERLTGFTQRLLRECSEQIIAECIERNIDPLPFVRRLSEHFGIKINLV